MQIHILTGKHWPASGTDDYERVHENAIELLAQAGYDANSTDEAGDSVTDWAQTELMDVMFRCPKVADLLDQVDDLNDLMAFRIKTLTEVQNLLAGNPWETKPVADSNRMRVSPLAYDFKAVELDAFNLFRGATFVQYSMMAQPGEPRYKVWTVMYFTDHAEGVHQEHVTLICRRSDGDRGNDELKSFYLHYTDKVDFIGAVRNPLDFDDNNWGS